MEHDIAIALAIIVAGGVAAQWLGSKLHFPSILFLLVVGVVAGPVTGLVKPTEMFGDALFPTVGLAVGLLLFEGGFSLRFRQLETERNVILRLTTLGLLVTWGVGIFSALVVLGLSGDQAAILSAILTVSGPTVILPLLEQIRPRERVGEVVRWEGILIDPIGAALSVVVVDAVLTSGESPAETALLVLLTALIGSALGCAGGFGLSYALRRHWVADRLQVPVALALLVAAVVLANEVRPEAGLFAATVMGIVVGNQRLAPASHIVDFGESLGVLILGSLFVVLGASVEPGQLREVWVGAVVVSVILLAVARPIAVFVSTIGSELRRNERLWLVTMAPRGIVAAAVSALFSIELAEGDKPFPELAPITFIVICVSVVSAAVFGNLGSRQLRVRKDPPRGLAIVGVNPTTLSLGEILSTLEVPVIFVDPDPDRSVEALAAGLLIYAGSTRSEDLDDALRGVGVRQALAVSDAEELNRAVIPRLAETLGRANVFYLPAAPSDDESEGEAGVSATAWGRRPFAGTAYRGGFSGLFDRGGTFEVLEHLPDGSDIPLMLIGPTRSVDIVTPGWDAKSLDDGTRLVVLRPAETPEHEPEGEPESEPAA